MKKIICFLFMAILFSQVAFGQLTGIKTIPGDYPTIASAITALNASGVGAGGVIFNVAAGYTETLPSSVAGTITTVTSSAANPIVFQKSGAGTNPKITAALLSASTATDGIIIFGGCDYVTFDAIDLQENTLNTTNQTDWGYAIVKASGTDGSQNITIKNCSITLNKTNATSVAIYSGNHTATSTTALTVTTLSGANSNEKIFNNTISNAYVGISVNGFNDPTPPHLFFDQNNEIGVAGANTITNFGGGATTIYGYYSAYQNNLKVANNSFTGAIAGTATLYALYCGVSNYSNVDIYNNTITIQYNTTNSVAIYGIYSGMGHTGTNNIVNIYNNNITGCTYTTGTGSFYGIYHISTCFALNIYGNNITNNTLGSATLVGTGTFAGMYTFGASTLSGSTENVYNNTITGNTRLQSTPGAGTTYYYYNSASRVTTNIYNNLISNNTPAATGTTYCIYNTAGPDNKNIYGNTISNILNANGTIYGIYQTTGITIAISKNKIFNLNTNGTASTIYGVYVSSGTTVHVYNNFISELKTPLGTNNPAIYGLYISTPTTCNAYYNTIYLNATSTGGTFGATGIYASSTPTVDLRNNIVANNSTPGATGRVVAYQRSSTTLTSYSNLSNTNDFYAGIPGTGNLIFYDGTNSDQTLAAFKTRVSPRDASSVTENPPFVNVATTPYDLHIPYNALSQCESGGSTVAAPIAITTDYDGNSRYPNAGYPNNVGSPATAPDIGADEFGGLLLDLTPPNIAYTALGNTSLTAARTLTTTITDATGVPNSGAGLPRLYWKINSGAYTGVTGVSIGGNQYTFTFGAGAVLNDVISYYIVAQDIVATPNVGASPSGGAAGFTASPPACSTPPATPSSYIIVSTLSGVYPVGVGQVYPTVTAAVADLNLKEVVGPVTFELWDASYSASENTGFPDRVGE